MNESSGRSKKKKKKKLKNYKVIFAKLVNVRKAIIKQ